MGVLALPESQILLYHSTHHDEPRKEQQAGAEERGDKQASTGESWKKEGNQEVGRGRQGAICWVFPLEARSLPTSHPLSFIIRRTLYHQVQHKLTTFRF